ncbi:GNAT family N-acetyltransferase [Pseudomonas syringae]|jgi:GNAT superfamily N-acetyltransferase|uniref:GNAT family N-acetyltransferase n=2 Tax=Pseudomonas syringae group TaxID=136849 RepID=A0A9Q4A286_PSESX|nr:GNAT family N-acetyltransferase [Pseudomonas syringae]KTB60227.1 histone acetyltransferase [Pseudomonas viridiflava ICMP 13104]KTB87679.1 histone acetyltransferase [Pseudomonas syringae pv. syringae PD2766]MCF5469377.1 GNAT family N-acetyltransferase [Pseudomonas syringae]MCF5475659.1 GNAT family N-acetyltransferase [Pseudomonas syringae]MCF5485550.1 GNAT family N-acetyltransferase [Pseudomonas syringae]
MDTPSSDSGVIQLSLDKDLLDIAFIHAFLTTSSWAAGISIDRVHTSIANSLCVGAFDGQQQVGFARLVTDFATFGYLCDVFVDAQYRGQGLGRRLSEALLGVPEVQSLRRILLATTTAPWLYEKLDFTPVNKPNYIWQLHRPDVYST